jgi:hypothetical protein
MLLVRSLAADDDHAEQPVPAEPAWRPRVRFRPLALILAWILSAAALLVAAWIVPGAHVNNFWSALVARRVIAVLNAVLPPIVAALRLPLMLVLGLLLILVLDALMLSPRPDHRRRSRDRLVLVRARRRARRGRVGVVLDVIFGTNDDDTYTYRVIQRIARRSGEQTITDAPGIIFLEIDGLALPVLQRAMRDGNAPNMARWLQDGATSSRSGRPTSRPRRVRARPGSCSARTRTSRPFRWVVKESAKLVAVLRPGRLRGDRAHPFDRARASRQRGSPAAATSVRRADHVILTVSRMDAEKKATPGYRRSSRTASTSSGRSSSSLGGRPRAVRRGEGTAPDVRPRGHRGGLYRFMRAAMCVFVAT